MNTELTPKRLELLSELVPQAKAIGLLVNPKNPQTEGVVKNAQEAATAMRVRLQIVNAGTDARKSMQRSSRSVNRTPPG